MKQAVLGFYGYFLIFLAGCLTAPLLVALIYRETGCAAAFLITIAVCAVPGAVFRKTSGLRFHDSRLRQRYGYMIASSAWLVASVIGALPYLITGSIPDAADTFFETCSGFSTTGSTILEEIESLPKSILFWRSLTQWIGGMGIMVLFAALLPDFGIKGQSIAGAETPGPVMTKVSSRFSGTARLMYTAYIILTIALTVLLIPGGMGLYDAVCHAMTCMATGGYSTYNDGVMHFNSYYIYWVLTVFMFLAGTNFNLFFVALRGNLRKALRDDEFRAYCIILLASIAMITSSLMTAGRYTDFGKALTDAAFQAVTVMTTTGYASADFILWPAFAQMILVLLMFSGGCSSSTAGGIKVVRVIVFLRMIKHEIMRILHLNIIDDIKYNRRRMMPETLTYILAFLTAYIFTLTGATLLLSATGDGNLVTNFTAALTCISNVGPGLDLAGPVCNFHFYSDFSTTLLSLLMIAGRLELFTFMVLFTKYFWRPDRV